MYEALDDRNLFQRIVEFPLMAMIVALVAVILTVGLASLIGESLAKIYPGLDKEILTDLLAVPALLLVFKFGVAQLGEQPRDDLPFDWRDVRWLAAGLIGGALIFSLAVAVAALLGVYRIVGMGTFNGLLPALIASAIFPAVSEEIIFRGIFFRWLEEFGGSWVALLLTSAFFGASHLFNPHASAIAAIGIAFEAGVMLGAAYMLTRSLWLPMGLHAAWNFTQGEVYDIPVSGTDVHGLIKARLIGDPLMTGNGFGLEASIIAIVIATVFGLWLLRRAIREGQLMQPWWTRRRRYREVSSLAN